ASAAGEEASEVEVGADADVLAKGLLDVEFHLVDIEIKGVVVGGGEASKITELAAAGTDRIRRVTAQSSHAKGATAANAHGGTVDGGPVVVLPTGHDVDISAEFNATRHGSRSRDGSRRCDRGQDGRQCVDA